MDRPFLFDAVLFDLDGTLVATDRFWIEAAERGGRRAFAQLGLERPLPTAAEWMSLVGLPLELGFRRLFPDLSEAARATVMRACNEEEAAALERDGAPAMPAARATLERLRDAGARLGIASNCTLDYLRRMLDGLGIRALIQGAYCAESPDITSKADMVGRLLDDLQAESAVMVGDRTSDRDAAWANGLPHVHCAFGFAQGDEQVASEACIAALDELPARLARRTLWIRAQLQALGLLDRPAQRVGVSGGAAVGKKLFAGHAARVLRAAGRPAEALDVGAFASGRDPEVGEGDPLGVALDLERLRREVLAPHARGTAFDLPDGRRVEPGTTLFLAGPFLLGARRRVALDRLILLEAADEVRLRRLRGRERRRRPGPSPTAPAAAEATAEALLGPSDRLQRALLERFPSATHADLVLEASNALGPSSDAVPPGTPRGGSGLVRH